MKVQDKQADRDFFYRGIEAVKRGHPSEEAPPLGSGTCFNVMYCFPCNNKMFEFFAYWLKGGGADVVLLLAKIRRIFYWVCDFLMWTPVKWKIGFGVRMDLSIGSDVKSLMIMT